MARRRAALALAAVLVAVPAAALAAADPYVGNGQDRQWHLERVRAPEAWSTTRGGGGIVAIIDTGVRLTHEDLADRILRNGNGQVVGRDFVENDDEPNDEQGHGTLVAGLVAATEGNGLGGAGVGPRLRIMPIRVLDEDGSGNGDDVSAAIRWAADRGADVINLSLECSGAGLGGLLDGLSCSALGGAPEEAVAYAASRGAVVVAAAGNDGSSFTDYGSNSPVLLVGATDRDDTISSFSDRGRSDVLMAPGEDIVSTWCRTSPETPCNRNDTYGKADGTSFAAPQVAAAVAMLMAEGLSGPQAVARVRATARDLGSAGPDSTYGHGLLDVAAAVAGLGPTEPDPTAPDPDPTRPDPDPTTQRPAPDPTTDEPDPGPTSSPTPSPTSSPTPSPTAVPSPSPTPSPPPTEVTVVATSDGDGDARPKLIAVALLVLAAAAQVGWRVSDRGVG